jgi:FkbM family methyltransferase
VPAGIAQSDRPEMAPTSDAPDRLHVLGSACRPFSHVQPRRTAVLLSTSVASPLRHLHLPRAATRRLAITGPFKVRGADFRLSARGGSLESRLFWQGIKAWEPATLRAWLEACRRATCVFDVGASIGLFALTARAANPAAEVVAFEPVPPVHKTLARNVRLNGYRVSLERLALSDRDGVAEINWRPGKPSSGSLKDYRAPRILSEKVERFPVTLRRLDNYLEQMGLRPDLIKVDVEGAEPEVLRGLGAAFASLRPTVFVEVLDDETGAEVERLIPAGYRLLALDEREGMREVTSLRTGKEKNCPGGARNYVLYHLESPVILSQK